VTPPVKPVPVITAPANEKDYTNTAKPFDVIARPLHRVNSPTYDVTVDAIRPAGVEPKVPPDGLAAKSGARNPAMFVNSKIFQDFLKTLQNTILKLTGLAAFKAAIDELANRIAGRRPIDELEDAIAKAIAQSIEGALFDRYMRVIPAWVPVGRVKYGPRFVYDEQPASPRETQVEEEREVEGLVTASYQHSNSLPNTQWSHYWHWAFHVRPLPGYRHLIGRGNRRHPNELKDVGTDESRGKLREMLHIYGQVDQNVDAGRDIGAIECLWDVGGMSQPRGDGGTDGVMFHGNFPFWPQTGDHIWTVGRFSYDCARAIVDAGEFMPTMINPCKALAVARFESFKFPENAGGVPAVRFFFLATTEGGYFDFRHVVDREGKLHHEQDGTRADGTPKFKGINLRDRDYEFIIDLPPTDEKRGVYPIGRTTDFMTNTLVMRPRLLAQFRFAPFETKNPTQDRPADRPPWGSDIFFHQIDVPDGTTVDPKRDIRPRVEIIQPSDPSEAPRQVRVKVPLSALPPLPGETADRHEVYGVELALGWYDPVGTEAAKLTKVVVDIKNLRFHGVHSTNTAHFKACVNGQWRAAQINGVRRSNLPSDPNVPDAPGVRAAHALPTEFTGITLFLPPGTRIAVTTHGSWVHGYGEFMERKTKKDRELRFGGLIELPPALDDELKELRRRAADPNTPMPPELRKRQQDLEEILQVLDNFIGKRTTADWLVDIDNDRTDEQRPANSDPLTDEQKKVIEQERVSALARSLFVDPIAAFNQNDEPMGWCTFVDPTDTRLTTVSSMDPPPDKVGTIDKLLDVQNQTGVKVSHVNVVANRIWQVGSGNNLGLQLTEFRGEKQVVDYSMVIEFSTTPGAGPNPSPVPPPPPLPPNEQSDPSIRQDSVRVRVNVGPSIVPPSVNVLVPGAPTIVPASVTVRSAQSPSIIPSSVTVRVRR
jgi:hypothetical protein